MPGNSTFLLLSLIIVKFVLQHPLLVDATLFKQIFKEGNFWVPKMQKISLAKTLVECGSFCVADKVNAI